MTILRAYFSFSGRAGRAEYAAVFLSAFCLLFVGIFVIAAAGISPGYPAWLAVALIVVWVALVEWAILATAAKRLHDLGRGTYDIIYTLMPVVGLVVLLGLMFVAGTDGANAHGASRGFFARF